VKKWVSTPRVPASPRMAEGCAGGTVHVGAGGGRFLLGVRGVISKNFFESLSATSYILVSENGLLQR